MSSKRTIVRISDCFESNIVSFGPFDEDLGKRVFNLLVEKQRGNFVEIHLDAYTPDEPPVDVDLD